MTTHRFVRHQHVQTRAISDCILPPTLSLSKCLQAYKVTITSSPFSTDTNYRGQQTSDLNFTNTDDDEIGLIVSNIVVEKNGTTSENKLLTAKVRTIPCSNVCYVCLQPNNLQP